ALSLRRGRPSPRHALSLRRGRPSPRHIFLVPGLPNPGTVDLSRLEKLPGRRVGGGGLSGSPRVTYSAHLAQLVEHVLGKDEVTSSILVVGSKRMFRTWSCQPTRARSESARWGGQLQGECGESRA